ncbi:unnamed protein product [Euphydryas editha]|uniref:Fucosyltransferase n=1 Tax=Euphydryas editha TaxID=104508 RepID=A0AAU9TPA7_EUPED|nr:unnamed protein product [Euphydryas editha]
MLRKSCCHCVQKNFTRIAILIIFTYFMMLLFTYTSRLNATMPEREKIKYLGTREIKYILQWTNKSLAPFNFMKEGNLAFVKNGCRFTNCYVTNDSKYTYLNEFDFDAIAFNGRDMIQLDQSKMPHHRNPRQKYVFGAMESADNFPVCDERFDGFFNWTWTYKLDSDFRWGYITVFDLKGTVVGPAVDMKWEKEMRPISEDLKVKLSNKTKAAAWFVSHCSTKSRREDFVKEVQRELVPYNLTVDIYGRCGTLECKKSNKKLCFKQIERNYYFYFSLENSFAEDYVTEKLLIALENYAVPVVFGAANYSRYL